ncbi:adapter-related protein complex 4 sigma 1 subunit [Heterostelium album PN500]|uniref:AP complex subunit sigma n=1 Tax=Heterostelium pallidum (strain ATCC 26659 / Pp 5 / PN500) TaxID=670386 RepID=D3B6C9_HETP5|nr:adapter-related protein complex 4 sigma 1 subunit [Heterostelium album PN500]EFA82899.1 adapter-related protein complex 4 sigma 1 subunit [Heterostelium album PN500]|eukprot:XP_020435016.1 adapter-related protein complex 4 sigma 1 subunit [Heterostelium album PN500]
MIKFFLLANRQGQIRLSQYYENIPFEQRPAIEAEIIRKCVSRNASQCSYIEYHSYKVIYRKYSSLYFIVGVDNSENELAILELIHNYVEILDTSFEQVVYKAHFILDEMISNGNIVEISKNAILDYVNLMTLTDR